METAFGFMLRQRKLGYGSVVSALVGPQQDNHIDTHAHTLLHPERKQVERM